MSCESFILFVEMRSNSVRLPCLSKLSSRKMQTNAKNLFTSRKYKIVPLFNLIKLELWLSNAAASKSSLNLKQVSSVKRKLQTAKLYTGIQLKYIYTHICRKHQWQHRSYHNIVHNSAYRQASCQSQYRFLRQHRIRMLSQSRSSMNVIKFFKTWHWNVCCH